MGERRHPLEQLPGAGVLGVEAEDKGDELVIAVVLVPAFLHEGQVVGEVVDAATEHGAEAAVGGGLRNLVGEHVHVEVGGDAARQVFHDRQPRQVVDVARPELRLHREALLEPVVERLVVRVGAQEGHPRMGVRVFEAGQEQVAPRVDFPVPDGAVRRAGGGDAVPLHPELPLGDARALLHREDARVIESDVHTGPSSWSSPPEKSAARLSV